MSKFNSQICTSREQSERLLKLGLKKETADCNLTNYSLKGKGYQDDWQVGTTPYSDCLESWRAFAKDSCWELIPTWSLDRLRELIPENIFTGIRNQWHRVMYNGFLTYEEGDESLVSFSEANIYDRCISCIEWLIKEGYFNKEYLV